MSHNKNKEPMDSFTQGASRRDFLRLSALAGALAVSSGLWLPGRTWAEERQPKKGGTLRLGLAGGTTSDSFDPGSWSDSFTFVGFSAVYNTLVEIDTDGSAIPELAESWEPSPDARVWTFKLRPGVTFHNGKRLTVEDVVESIRFHLGEHSTSAAKAVLGDVQRIRAAGHDSVVFELRTGHADFPLILADYHLVILPLKEGALDWQAGIGTGGYVLRKFQPGVRMHLERNPNYWKAGRAHFDSAELLAISDGSARINALVTGRVDVINKVDPKTVGMLKRNPRLVIEETAAAQHYTFPMNSRSPEFRDPNVRLAFKHAVDREGLLKSILHGHGVVGNDHPLQPGNRYFDAGLEQRQYDPDKARFYLRQAGLESFRINLHASDAAYSGAVDASVLFKEHARKADIDITVVREPADGFFSNVWMKRPFTSSFFYSNLSADRMFSLGYAKGAAWNETFWENERFNQLLQQAKAELDEPRRREMYAEMQQLCRDDSGALIPLFANSVAARSTRVTHGGQTAPFGELDGLRIIERWWQA